jgi:flagellar protein FlbT
MKKSMQISLKAGERIYINGAVVRVDRKVSLELLNDVVFLLEAHVLQADQTTTPLRQLYFILQTMLMDPLNAEATKGLFLDALASTVASFSNETALAGLQAVAQLVAGGRIFDALRTIRGLYAVEEAILAGPGKRASRAA